MCSELYTPRTSERKIPQEVSAAHSVIQELVLSDEASAASRRVGSSSFPSASCSSLRSLPVAEGFVFDDDDSH